jgi:hypothetical protein
MVTNGGTKIFQYIITILVLLTLNFFLPRMMPGDPMSYLLGNPGADAPMLLTEEMRANLLEYSTLLAGGVALNSAQEIVEGNFGGRTVLGWIVEGVDVPTDEGVIGAKDPGPFLHESVGALPGVCVVEDVDEGIVGEDNADLYDCVVQDLNIVRGNEGRAITSALDVTGELERAYASH